MTSPIAKLAVAISGCLALFGAGAAAHAASTAEVAVANKVAMPASVGRMESSVAPTRIIAANQRETNLRKTATFVIVSDTAPTRRQRGSR